MKKHVALFVALLCLVGCGKATDPDQAQQLTEQTSRFVENSHYTVLKSPIVRKPVSGNENFIIYYFWLGCPSCQNFSPIVDAYITENPNVELVRTHAALGGRWALDALIYYGLLHIGMGQYFGDLLNLYTELRVKNNKLPDSDDITNFLNEKNIDIDFFESVYESDEVVNEIEIGISEMNGNEITGVPSLVVKGKYLLNLEYIQNQEDFNLLINYLISK